MLAKYGARATVALNSDVCDYYPQIIDEGKALGWEFMGHNESNSRPFNQTPPEDERRLIHNTFARIERATGERPKGWLSAGLIES